MQAYNMQAYKNASNNIQIVNVNKMMFVTLQRKQRGGKAATEEELTSSLMNKAPGCPPLTILSFDKAFHGRTMGMCVTYVYIY